MLKHNKMHENRIQVCPNVNSQCEEHSSSLNHNLFQTKAEGSALWLRSIRNEDQHVWQLLGVAVGFCALCTSGVEPTNFPAVNAAGSTQLVPLPSMIMTAIAYSQMGAFSCICYK